MEIYSCNIVAASNNSAPPNGAPENTMQYNEVNDTFRELMAMLKRWQVASQSATLTTATSTTAYTLTSGQGIAAYAAGQTFSFVAHATSTGAVTLNVDGNGALPVVDGNGVQLGANDLISGALYVVTKKSGAFFQLISSQAKVTAGTESVAGILELATNAEALTGTDTARAITPANLTHVFNNRPATESVQGAVEMATDAEIRSAAAGAKAVMAEDIETASAAVTATDAATVAINWDAAINFDLTMAGNRTLGNPTNGQPGTWRTVWVRGNDATVRTLTFGAQFGGDLPTLNDISNTRQYLISIYCATTTYFVASAHRSV